MGDVYDMLVDVVRVIREDAKLKNAFNKILGAGHGAQRVPLLLTELETLNAPDRVVKFVRLLSDDDIPKVVLMELNR